MQNEITSRQLWLWIAAAMSAQLAHFSGCGWVAMLLAAMATLPLTLLAQKGWESMGKTLRVIEFFWMSGVAGILLQNSGVYWPSGRNELVVPLTLLAITAISNAAAGPRTGPVIAMMLVVLYVPVLIAGSAQLEFGWLEPRVGNWQSGLLVTLLLPALAGAWGPAINGTGKAIIGIGLMALLFGVLTQGLLSWQVAQGTPIPFYEVTRTVQIGATTRLESVVAVAMSLGWYALASFLITTASRVLEDVGVKGKHGIVIASGIGALYLVLQIDLPDICEVCVAGILWIVAPFVCRKNKCRNSKNNA